MISPDNKSLFEALRAALRAHSARTAERAWLLRTLEALSSNSPGPRALEELRIAAESVRVSCLGHNSLRFESPDLTLTSDELYVIQWLLGYPPIAYNGPFARPAEPQGRLTWTCSASAD